MIFDKARTTEMKQQKFILPFTADMAACEGRGAVWVKAWKEGKEEYESRKSKAFLMYKFYLNKPLLKYIYGCFSFMLYS